MQLNSSSPVGFSDIVAANKKRLSLETNNYFDIYVALNLPQILKFNSNATQFERVTFCLIFRFGLITIPNLTVGGYVDTKNTDELILPGLPTEFAMEVTIIQLYTV